METFTFEEIPYINPSSFFPPENPNPNRSVQETLNYPNFNEFNNILDPEDPLSDPVLWSFCNEIDDIDVAETSGAGHGPSKLTGEGCSHGGIEFFDIPDISFPCDNSTQTPSYNCICCQKLRVITHTNGMTVKRLEIHGRWGVIAHAVQEIHFHHSSSSNNQEMVMFDFQKESMDTVKNFLIQYFQACKQEGFSTLQDPLSSFYEALSVGLDCHRNLNDSLLSQPQNTGENIQCVHTKIHRQNSNS
ncbi:uncharacterized protein LOC127246735 [Andrographis paniculata]|uniref:uncharacterized protein LOC127246735 n=1 Tax=Andrographis paniculata TaxID=175694 RepID=UPI0021E8312F|nr:uncharacterized protein LOC127246735 [Andrographis paniculata]